MKNKLRLTDKLPLVFDDFELRKMNRQDLDLRANWPSYPPPYEMFDATYKNKPFEEREIKWKKIENDEKLVCLVLAHTHEKLVGIYYLAEINWEEKTVNNMTVRLHPDWCDKGIGTKALKELTYLCLDNGFKSIKLDVLSTNVRAIKSYQKAGFKIIGEFELNNERFYWMELNERLGTHVHVGLSLCGSSHAI